MSNIKPKNTDQYDWLIKLIFLGDSGVGKSNLITRYCEGKFSGNYMATIGVDFKIKTIQVQDKRIKLQIWDTAGQERFKNITQTYYRGAYGIVFVYSITDRNSFENVEGWIKSIRESLPEDICSILVANKSDLEKDRRVDSAEGRDLAARFHMMFIETSAKEGENVGKIFDMLGEQLLIKLSKMEPIDPVALKQQQGQTTQLHSDRPAQSEEEEEQQKRCSC